MLSRGMRLDIPTLGAGLLLVYATNALLSSFLLATRQSFRGAGIWLVGQACLGLGFAALLFRGALPQALALALPNGLFIAGFVLDASAIWKFRRSKPFPEPLYALPLLSGLAFAAMAGLSFDFRVLVFSLLAAGGSGLVAYLLLEDVEEHYRLANGLTALPFILLALANLARAGSRLLGRGAPSFEAQEGLDAVYLLLGMAISSVALFGYVMMTGIRFERERLLRLAQLERANTELAELARTRALFISILAHDLRGPVASAARLIRRRVLAPGEGKEARLEALGTVAEGLELSASLLDSLLSWARAQEGGWKPQIGPLDAQALLEEARAIGLQAGADKGIRIELRPPERVGPDGAAVLGDRHGVALVLRNLVSNAVKYSPTGALVLLGAEGRGAETVFEVEDEGQGIPPELLSALFKPEALRSRRGTAGERGSGFGLILAREIAEKMGGRLELESVRGRGTKARLLLPRSASEARAEA